MAKTRSSETEKPLLLTSPVRYIKLGPGGSWESDCIKQGVIRFGFGTGRNDRFRMCIEQAWDELKTSLQDSGATKKGKVTENLGQIQRFFMDDGSTLWFTFHKKELYWGRLDNSQPTKSRDGLSVFRTVSGGWKNTDLKGSKLEVVALAGHLAQLESYRGTSCVPFLPEYVIRRINGEPMPQVQRAVKAMGAMKSSVVGLMKLLQPGDFEILVDLVFTVSGWRRLGDVGKNQKMVDIDLLLPSTGERAFVQIKSKTTSVELAEYVTKFHLDDKYQRMFFVYHTGNPRMDEDESVHLLGPERFAELIINAGLTNWLIQKVS